jgi:hypothetical protein
MQDAIDLFQELVGDDIMTRLSHYAIRRGGTWGFEIYVCEFLSGPKAGSFSAFPRIGSTSSHDKYFGHGNTEQQALHDCLRKARGVSYETMFPEPITS